MLRIALWAGRIALCALGPGLMYYGFVLHRMGQDLKRTLPAPHQMAWDAKKDAATAKIIEAIAAEERDLEQQASLRMAASDMATFAKDSYSLQLLSSRAYRAAGLGVVAVGIMLSYLWWHFALGPSL